MVSNISLILFLFLSLAVFFISIQQRRKTGKVRFSGLGKENTMLMVLIYVLGGIYLITSEGWLKYVVFMLSFIVYYFVSQFYVGENGVKFGIYFIPYHKVTGYRQYDGSNDVTLYIEGKSKGIYLKPKIEYRSSLIQSALEMKGISEQQR